MKAIAVLRTAQQATGRSLTVFARDVGHGLLEIGHNTLAVVGLAVVAVLVFVAGREDLRQQAETMAFEWLQTRHEVRVAATTEAELVPAEPEAVNRATAADPKALTRQQAAVASWISRRYKVAPEPISALVQEAWAIGQKAGLDPTLILAIMAVESSFNPFAQSSVGAQGLMQVMTRIHDDKYQAFGGTHAAFDPISNLRVGVQVLKECISRAGGLQEGLKHYVGAALQDSDNGYVDRVMTEQDYLKRVAAGSRVPVTAPISVPREAAPMPLAPAQPAPPRAEQLAMLRH
ncbi:MAG: transglycosylase SLT domain-containing protein [Rubrivivax sp.]